MRIEKRTLNWLPKPSLYQEQASSRAKQRATHQDFISTSSSLSTSVGNILTNNTAEQTNLVSRVALERMGYSKKA